MTAPDPFAAFVQVLTDSLDDQTAYGDALAARVHLSRFHFDRLVSAAAGEPPAAMRRRILLERAAYRLQSTDQDVLRVAVEAGYASNEAFTRAFARSFGRPPSQWRRNPSSLRLDAPNGVHFHPPGGLRVAVPGKVTGMDLLSRIVTHHVWLVGELLDRAGQLTDEQLSAPVDLSVDGIDDDPTVLSLLARLVGQLAMWDASTRSAPYDVEGERRESLAEVRAKLAWAGPAFLSTVRAVVDEGRVDETFVDATCDPPYVCTYGGMVAHVLTFAAHRRLLVLGALSDAGIKDL